MEMKSVTLPDNELKRLFDRFSLPMTKPCITAKQKQNAIEIAKILWLRLVTGTDTEECVYQDLKRIIGDKHDDIIALGNLLVTMERPWVAWMAYNAVREPDGSYFTLNRAIETRTGAGGFDTWELPLAERIPLARAFAPTVDEYRTHLQARRQRLLETWRPSRWTIASPSKQTYLRCLENPNFG